MKNSFYNNSLGNIYIKPSLKSEVISQILYGEEFKILSKKNSWFKIKTNFDKYIGFIKQKNFLKKFNPSHKIYKIKSQIFTKRDDKFILTRNVLHFGSGISAKKTYKNFIKFDNNKWIKKKDLKKIDHCEKNFVRIFKLFLNTNYLWGGKTSKGIDCSALVQIYFYYNRIFFPRDSKDQVKFCKKKIKKNFDKGDIIFWKGHVGICIDKSKFIHAYRPRKKVLIMPINLVIKLINKTTNLKVKKISNLKNY